jgi:hypothetical protein
LAAFFAAWSRVEERDLSQREMEEEEGAQQQREMEEEEEREQQQHRLNCITCVSGSLRGSPLSNTVTQQ